MTKDINKEIEKQKENNKIKKAQEFLKEYNELTEKHQVHLVAVLHGTPSTIEARLNVEELPQQPQQEELEEKK